MSVITEFVNRVNLNPFKADWLYNTKTREITKNIEDNEMLVRIKQLKMVHFPFKFVWITNNQPWGSLISIVPCSSLGFDPVTTCKLNTYF